MVAFACSAAPARAQVAASPPIVAPRRFADEREAQAFVVRFLDARGWHYVEQYRTPSGGRIDICLMNGDTPSMGIEIKPAIDANTNASELADHFEQALGYSMDLDVPVLLGPVMYPIASGFDALHLGGHELRAIPALTIIGGRANVGVFAFDSTTPTARACMALRGQVFYRYCERRGLDTFVEADRALRMVRSRASKKVRE